MKRWNFVSVFIRVNLIALLFTASAWAGTLYDLTADWSDTTNPNGVWSVNSGPVGLQPVTDLSDTGIDYFPTPQPGFTALPIFGDIVPVWFRSTGPLDNGNPDWEIGDIITHTSRFDIPNSNVTWTSDFDGAIDILGSVWPTREMGGVNDWFLYHNDTLLTGGTIQSFDPFDRSSPFYFELGAAGLSVLRDIPVIVGDVVKLELEHEGAGSEDYVGVDLKIVGKPVISCAGFAPPMKNYPVAVKKNRVLPLKAELLDAEGVLVLGGDLTAPPIFQVWYEYGTTEEDDASFYALPAGKGAEGNQFVFTDDDKWQFNLKTSNYSGPGTYTVIMESGDPSEYVVIPSCVTEFIVK
jgi:hypothetical protein